MNNTKVKEIIKFSCYKNIQNKWFIVFNILTLLTIITVANWNSIYSAFKFNKEENVFGIAVLDSSNIVYDTFLNDMSGDNRYEISKIESNNYTAENIPNNFMVIEVKEDEVEGFKVSIISKEGIKLEIYDPIKNELYNIRNQKLSNRYSVEKDKIEVFQKDLSINRILLSVKAEDSNTKQIVKSISALLTYVVSFFIFINISNDIVSEKQSKSTEYILTTVSEKEYLFAKIFSNIAVVLIQGLLIIVYYFIAILLSNVAKSINVDFSLTTSIISASLTKDMITYILMLIIYNVLNVILQCIILATLASKTTSTLESGNALSILLIIVMVAYFSTEFFITPYSKVNIILYIISCVPILSAYFVPGIMVVGQATLLQIIISLSLLVISIPITFRCCSKIFKNGILDYTKVKKTKKTLKTNEEKEKDFLAKREMRRFGFVIGISIIIYVGLQTIFSLIGGAILPIILGNILNETEINLVLQILLQVISLGVAILFVNAYLNGAKEKLAKMNISVKTKTKLVLVALFLVFLLQVILSLLIYPLIGLDYNITDTFNVDNNSRILSKIILMLTLAITPAIFEELFFRKAIINFSIRYGKIFALLFSAGLFGLIHMNLSQGLFAFIMGLLFGAIYIYTGDIKLTILIHLLNNGFAALELILPELGVLIATATLFIILIIGSLISIKMITKKEIREKLFKICNKKISIKGFEEKYKYIFTDYTFDISIILIALMSIITEKILR